MRSLLSRAAAIGASCVLCSVAVTAVGQVLPDSIHACKNEADSARRLECYDREVAKYPLTSAQSIGLSGAQLSAAQRQSPSPAAKVNMTAKVVAVRDRPNAGSVVTLDNGQVWVQYEEESVRGIHVGDMVTVTPGALGSFWLTGPTGGGTKARRLK